MVTSISSGANIYSTIRYKKRQREKVRIQVEIRTSILNQLVNYTLLKTRISW